MRMLALAFALLAASAGGASAQTLAITEFMHDPVGEEDRGREWVEIFNFGAEPIDLAGFTLADQTGDIVTLPSTQVVPGDFIIVVPSGLRHRTDAEAKELFEAEWLAGKADSRVHGVTGRFSLGNGQDQIVLNNAQRRPIWAIAYRGDGTEGRATFLHTEDFRIRLFGTANSPGVNRSGPDSVRAAEPFLGYESNDATGDTLAYESDVSQLENLWGPLYKSVTNGGDAGPGTGSPLKGHYTGVKKQ